MAEDQAGAQLILARFRLVIPWDDERKSMLIFLLLVPLPFKCCRPCYMHNGLVVFPARRGPATRAYLRSHTDRSLLPEYVAQWICQKPVEAAKTLGMF